MELYDDLDIQLNMYHTFNACTILHFWMDIWPNPMAFLFRLLSIPIGKSKDNFNFHAVTPIFDKKGIAASTAFTCQSVWVP